MRGLLIRLCLFTALILNLASCTGQQMLDHAEVDIIRIKGVIRYLQMEGGFYGIIGDNGEKYKPMSLEREFKVDGLKVKVQARLVEGIAGIHMWGKHIDVLEIEKLQ